MKGNKIDLKELSNEEVKQLIISKQVTAADLTDAGICPTCFNRNNDYVVFGDDSEKMIYEDDDFECYLVGNPRANGHVNISTKEHYKDMMEIPDDICIKAYLLAKKVMNTIKEVYESESVYLCTMCDGTMNHFHIQLIPRYSFEKRGSKNFVKPRSEYVEDKEKIKVLRKKLSK